MIMICGRNVIMIKSLVFTHHLNQRDLVKVFVLESGTKIMYTMPKSIDSIGRYIVLILNMGTVIQNFK